jgi:hypothetical protein
MKVAIAEIRQSQPPLSPPILRRPAVRKSHPPARGHPIGRANPLVISKSFI